MNVINRRFIPSSSTHVFLLFFVGKNKESKPKYSFSRDCKLIHLLYTKYSESTNSGRLRAVLIESETPLSLFLGTTENVLSPGSVSPAASTAQSLQ